MNRTDVLSSIPQRSETHEPRRAAVFSLVALGILSISTASILIRMAEAPALVIAAYRTGLATLMLLPWVLIRRNRPSRAVILRALPVCALAGLFLSLHFAFWIQSLRMTSVASSATLVSTTPLFAALISFLLFRERPTRGLLTGIGIIMLGSAAIAGTDLTFSGKAFVGDLLALAGAAMAAAYFIAGERARRTLDLSTYATITYGVAALLLITFCLVGGIPLSGFTPETYACLFGLALVPQLIGHTVFNWSLRFLSPATVSALVLGEPIGATILAFLVLGEGVTVTKAVGLLLLGLGILLASRAMPPRAEAQPDTPSAASTEQRPVPSPPPPSGSG